ncbi:MAG TPA: M3 family metallopeptidase, partial [Anaerolineales bacterium]|nr:M3 family metallopeptidase [Anaerolineales bacterium]
MMADPVTALPHWDVSVVYPGLESGAFRDGFGRTVERIDRLLALVDRLGVPGTDSTGRVKDPTSALEQILAEQNGTLEDVTTLEAYIYAFVSTNTRDAVAQARLSELQQARVKLNLLAVRLSAWIGTLDVEALIAESESLGGHAYLLRRAKIRSAHLMSPPQEDLAAQLILTGSTAWEKLHSSFTSQIMVPLDVEGVTRQVPMSNVRAYRLDADGAMRKRAYEAEISAWKLTEVPLAAAMNSIKGEVATLARRRGWDSPLEAALFDHGIDRETLAAMQAASRESFPDFRRYLQAKGRALKAFPLPWWDIEAPLGDVSRPWSYAESQAFIEQGFARFSPALRDLAHRAFSESWIDAEPRDGKVGGAFCMWLKR